MNKNYFALHLLLMVYSLADIFSKLAAGYSFLSLGFFLCYGAMMLILFIYAIGWQQVIRRIPLTAAYANKAVTTIWGTIWGILLFHEGFSVGKLVGIMIIMAGIVLFTGDEAETDE